MRQQGFILSMEAVLLFTILGIGLLVGTVVLRDALITYYLSQENRRFFVADSSDPPILVGDVVGFDEYDAPLLVFVDYHEENANPLPGEFNFRALIGARDDRLTTRQVLLYDVANCAGPPVCIASPGSLSANAQLAGLAETSSTVSFIAPLQGDNAPAYAVGRDLLAAPGQDLLYRSSTAGCTSELVSMWVSQRLSVNACVNISPGISGANLAPFRLAEPVLLPDGSGENVLTGLQPPYLLNMVGNPRTELTRIAPSGEGG